MIKTQERNKKSLKKIGGPEKFFFMAFIIAKLASIDLY